jgi:hypothetical protein
MRRILPGMLMALLLASACTNSDTPTAPTWQVPAAESPTTVEFVSNPSSAAVPGTQTFTVQNATFQVGTDSRFINIGVLPLGATAPVWRVVLNPPSGQVLAPGQFSIGPSATGHGFEFSGSGFRCGGPGTLTIEEVRNTGIVERLRAHFSISSCGDGSVNGQIVLNWVAGVGYR